VPGPAFAVAKLANYLFRDPALELALGIAERLEAAREESKPLIMFLDHSGQLSILLPFKVYGNFLFYQFHGEVYVTYYDAARTYRLKGLPVVFCVENQLYPVYVLDAAVLSYLPQLRDMVLAAVRARREELARAHPELVRQLEEERRKAAEQGQVDPPDPLAENPLEQLDAILLLLQSGSAKDVLTGIRLGLAAVGAEFTPPIDARVIARYVPRRSTLRELLTYYERWAYAHFAAMAGLHQFYSRRLDFSRVLRALVLLGLLLLGAYFFMSYVLPGFAHAAAPAPPAGVKVP
jgi:hypothetical protein